MFNNKTVVVVGAGASSEANLPTGSELKGDIGKLLKYKFEMGTQLKAGDALILQALRIATQGGDRDELQRHIHEAQAIAEVMPLAISIDNFIEAHKGKKEIELCGKLAIVRAILAAEKRSLLYVDPGNIYNTIKHERLQHTWYNAFMQLLTEGCTVAGLPERLSSLAFVVFNYDRCIEHFLYHALQRYYRISAEKVVELLQLLQIYHPYGTVGRLPWQDRRQDAIEFGNEPNGAQLLSLASQIKTFTEGTNPDESDVLAIRERVHEARILVFLGFAFHRMNMQLLTAAPPTPSNKLMFCTASQISPGDCLVIRDELGTTFGGTATIRNDLKCGTFLREYWRTLSLS